MATNRVFLSVFAGLGLLSSCASTEEAAWDEARINLTVTSIMNDHRPDFEACYDQEVTRRGQLRPKQKPPQGAFKVNFAIGPLGGVLEAAVAPGSSTLKNPQIERCVVEKLEKIQFGKMGDYTRYNITYPFEF